MYGALCSLNVDGKVLDELREAREELLFGVCCRWNSVELRGPSKKEQDATQFT